MVFRFPRYIFPLKAGVVATLHLHTGSLNSYTTSDQVRASQSAVSTSGSRYALYISTSFPNIDRIQISLQFQQLLKSEKMYKKGERLSMTLDAETISNCRKPRTKHNKLAPSEQSINLKPSLFFLHQLTSKLEGIDYPIIHVSPGEHGMLSELRLV